MTSKSKARRSCGSAAKKYDEKGMRLTDCCGAHSTYSQDDGILICRACYRAVAIGEGDGAEYRKPTERRE